MENQDKILEIFAEKFEFIVPNRTDAKVLFSLFIDEKKNSEKTSYSELEIRELIKKYHKEDKGGESEPRQKVEERFQTLLRQQFLERNREKRIVLTDHSLQLCNFFYEKIQPLLNPSIIEKILEDVKTSLEAKCENVEDLKLWYQTQFVKVLKAEIANQTNAMDFQISELKDKLNEKFKTMPYEELVDYCQEQMDIVIEDRRKLTKSFSGLDAITDILASTSLNKLNSLDFIDIKRNLNETLEHYKFKLEQTGDNISKIKNIVRSLFDIVSKKAFDRKLETFFYQLLEDSNTESRSTRTDSEGSLFYSVEVSLPDFVQPISFIKDAPENFLYPEFYESFSVSKNQKAESVSRNLKNLETAAIKSRKRQEQARKIESWFNSLKEQLTAKEEVDYSTFYIEMLKAEDDVDLAIKGTEHILKKLRQEKFKIETTKDFTIDKNNPNNAVWNIKIKK
ncbi:MAG: hypothetical protein WBG71_14770 [Leeuwenhoekiella sp.]